MNILKKYKFELLIFIIQLIGPISAFGLLLGSVYVFYSIAFKRNLDLVSVFILLIPSIAFGYLTENTDIVNIYVMSNKWLKINFPAIKSVLILGPFAISIPFFAALAVPFRLTLNFKNNSNKPMLIVWFIVLLISLIGLIIAVVNNQKSAGGLTVGFRIALTVGTILFPLSIKWNQIEKQIAIILKISVVFFLLGFLNGLWKFVVFAFFAYLPFSNEKRVWKILAIVSLIIIITFKFSFTLLFTTLFGLFLVILYTYSKSGKFFLYFKPVRVMLFLFPLLFMFLMVSFNFLSDDSSMSFFSDRFREKLFADRLPIWTFSLDLVLNSNFFIVPAARDIQVIDYSKLGEDNWGFGAHNIYLEMARQLGVFATLLITVIIGTVFLKTFELIRKNKNLSKILLSLFAVYIVWGLTGNALVWDGTGFLYWLIIGQLYQSGLNYKRMLKRKRKENNLFRENVISADNVLMP